MNDNWEEQQKLLNALETSIECNSYNDKESGDFDWHALLESKFIKCTLGFFTLGVYPIYEVVKRNSLRSKLEAEGYITPFQSLREKQSDRNYRFANNLISYININSNSALSEQENKNNIFYATYILINTAAIIGTGGIFLIVLVARHVKNINLHNSLNAIIGEYKKERNESRQKIIQEKIDQEKQTAKELNESLKEIHGFNYENCIHESLDSNQESFAPVATDPFVLFLFYSSYALLTVLTLGGFLFYVEYQKRINGVNYNFFDHLLRKEVIDRHDFNIRLNDLSNNYDVNFDYAAILAQSSNSKSNIFDYTSLFRSVFFKDKLNKFLSLCFLSAVTLCIYPLYIFYKVAFCKNEYFLLSANEHKLEAIDIKDSEYFWNKLKIKYKHLYDFGFDIKIATNIAATKLWRSTSANQIKPTKHDLCFLFIRTVTSPIFKLAFTLVFLLLNYALFSLLMFTPFNSAILSVFVVSSALSVVLLSYHLFLLF